MVVVSLLPCVVVVCYECFRKINDQTVRDHYIESKKKKNVNIDDFSIEIDSSVICQWAL